MPQNSAPLPDFTRWPSFPFEGDMRVKELAPAVEVEPPRSGEDADDCVACKTPDEAYIWVSERWRVRAMDRPTGLPMVLILECRSHLDLGDLPNLLAAELGVMTVRLERAVRSLDGVARVHVNRWGDGAAHLHMWFLARPYGLLQLRGTFLSLWDDILPVIPEWQWRENLALVAAWLAEFGGRPLAEPPHIQWQSPSTIGEPSARDHAKEQAAAAPSSSASQERGPAGLAEAEGNGPQNATRPRAAESVDPADADTDDLSKSAAKLPGRTSPASHDDRSGDHRTMTADGVVSDAPGAHGSGKMRDTNGAAAQPVDVGWPEGDADEQGPRAAAPSSGAGGRD